MGISVLGNGSGNYVAFTSVCSKGVYATCIPCCLPSSSICTSRHPVIFKIGAEGMCERNVLLKSHTLSAKKK